MFNSDGNCGKENDEISSSLVNTHSNNTNDNIEKTATGNSKLSSVADTPILFSASAMYKSCVAMHLWWADNEELVRANDDTTDVKSLVPRAAILFKDLTEDEKKVGVNCV